MKTQKKILFSLLIAGSALTMNGCKKEKVKGCMDKNSVNYNPSAEEDDGTCKYEGTRVFWYNQTTAENLDYDGITSLTYYVDNVIVGSSSASVYYTGAPACGQNSSITVKKDLGGSKTKSYSYKVIDENGDEIWEGTVPFDANTCTATELIY